MATLPRHTRQGETHGTYGEDLPPEEALLCAMLQRCVADVRSQAHNWDSDRIRADAIRWLRDEAAVRFWLDSSRLDFEQVWPLLLAEAGLEGPP